jgi:hypothetical protein
MGSMVSGGTGCLSAPRRAPPSRPPPVYAPLPPRSEWLSGRAAVDYCGWVPGGDSTWHGTADDEDGDRESVTFRLTFADGRVMGCGVNVLGTTMSVAGEYSADSGRVAFVLSTPYGPVRPEWRAAWNGSDLIGRWTVSDSKTCGDFELHPWPRLSVEQMRTHALAKTAAVWAMPNKAEPLTQQPQQSSLSSSAPGQPLALNGVSLQIDGESKGAVPVAVGLGAGPAADGACVICLDRGGGRARFLPCGHDSFCEHCADRLRRESWTCPICRKAVASVSIVTAAAPPVATAAAAAASAPASASSA